MNQLNALSNRVEYDGFAHIGERHLWMYYFNSLRTLLNEAGSSRVERRLFNTSMQIDNLFATLGEIDGRLRNGNHQLLMEAQL